MSSLVNRSQELDDKIHQLGKDYEFYSAMVVKALDDTAVPHPIVDFNEVELSDDVILAGVNIANLSGDLITKKAQLYYPGAVVSGYNMDTHSFIIVYPTVYDTKERIRILYLNKMDLIRYELTELVDEYNTIQGEMAEVCRFVLGEESSCTLYGKIKFLSVEQILHLPEGDK